MSRTWIKIYCKPWCEGSLRKETPLLRSVWADIMAFVGDSKHADEGELKVAGEVGYTDKQLAGMFTITESEWVEQKARLVETARIALFGENCIRVVNWKKYQPEFWRTRLKKRRAETLLSEEDVSEEESAEEKEKEIEIGEERGEIGEREGEGEGGRRRRRTASRSPSGISFDFKKKSWVGITPEQETFWAGVYPGVNIKAELLKMAAWLDANADKAPASRFGAFINRWLKSEQNKAASRRPQGPWDNRPGWMKKAQERKGEPE